MFILRHTCNTSTYNMCVKAYCSFVCNSPWIRSQGHMLVGPQTWWLVLTVLEIRSPSPACDRNTGVGVLSLSLLCQPPVLPASLGEWPHRFISSGFLAAGSSATCLPFTRICEIACRAQPIGQGTFPCPLPLVYLKICSLVLSVKFSL